MSQNLKIRILHVQLHQRKDFLMKSPKMNMMMMSMSSNVKKSLKTDKIDELIKDVE